MSRCRLSMSRCVPVVSALLLALALPAQSGELYQWKDANGVTHYSDSPPPGQTDYQNRAIRSSGAGEATAEAPAPAESSQCTMARANLQLLQGEAPVGTDTDGDGKPDTQLTADQRANQAELASAAIKVHCGTTAAAAGDASR
ncbi:MAG: DUF4124 domain-containing protein [Lysobacter spongiicola]|nr:DUF4124 domain-containing protein [Lysobacter spongiicola]